MSRNHRNVAPHGMHVFRTGMYSLKAYSIELLQTRRCSTTMQFSVQRRQYELKKHAPMSRGLIIWLVTDAVTDQWSPVCKTTDKQRGVVDTQYDQVLLMTPSIKLLPDGSVLILFAASLGRHQEVMTSLCHCVLAVL